VLGLVGRCLAEGARVTTEAYPYGSGSTAIGAAFFAPERLRKPFHNQAATTRSVRVAPPPSRSIPGAVGLAATATDIGTVLEPDAAGADDADRLDGGDEADVTAAVTPRRTANGDHRP